MAKVKTAKQRITDYLKAKGYDVSEIREAFDDLDKADIELETAAQAIQKNTEWVTWYNQVVPEVQNTMAERDALKGQLAKLKSAMGAEGLDTSDLPAAPAAGAPVQDLEKFKSDLTKATSDVMKGVARYGFKHYKTFNEEPDYDAIEKVMSEKNVGFDMAYDVWSRPKYQEREAADYKKKLEDGIKEGIAAEMSKQGISRRRKPVDDVEPAPLDKAAPNDKDLRDAFIADMNGTTH